jgi:hypothetical protein
MEETWKDIVGHEGIYQVSSLFRVRKISGVRAGIMKIHEDRDGYFHISFRYNGARYSYLVHRLFYIAFHSAPPSPKHEILHIDGNNQNNALSNLRWGTHKENMEDKVKHGVNNGPLNYKGSGNPAAKINENDVLKIRAMYKNGLPQHTIGKLYDLSQSNIANIVTN